MNTIPFTNRQSIVKVFVVWMLGLAVLVGSTTVTYALPPLKPGATYCRCHCKGNTTGDDRYLEWPKVNSCGLNGTGCTIENKGNPKPPEAGTLEGCEECVAKDTLDFGSCKPGFPLPPNGPGSEVNPYRPHQNARPERKFDPFPKAPVRPGQNAPVEPTPTPPKFDPRAGVAPLGTVPFRSRGVEGEPPASAPTEQKDTTPAPK